MSLHVYACVCVRVCVFERVRCETTQRDHEKFSSMKYNRFGAATAQWTERVGKMDESTGPVTKYGVGSILCNSCAMEKRSRQDERIHWSQYSIYISHANCSSKV